MNIGDKVVCAVEVHPNSPNACLLDLKIFKAEGVIPTVGDKKVYVIRDLFQSTAGIGIRLIAIMKNIIANKGAFIP